MKGSGDSAFTLFSIAFMLICVSILIYVVTNEQVKRSEIIASDADLAKTKNTFHLLDRSLSFTWFISSVQTVFRTFDDSIGCGIDDADFEEQPDSLPSHYWYRYDPLVKKTNKAVGRLPETENIKYNFDDPKYQGIVQNPKICYPKKENNIEYHVLKYMNNKLLSYLEIPKEFKILGILIKIQNLKLDDVVFNADGPEFKVSQRLLLDSSLTDITNEVQHSSQIYTELEKIVEAARQIVVIFIKTSDSLVKEESEPTTGSTFAFPPAYPFDLSKRYLDSAIGALGFQPTENKEKYVEKFKEDMKKNVDDLVEQAGFSITTHAFAWNKLELFASDETGSTNFGAQCVNSVCIGIDSQPKGPCTPQNSCGEHSDLIIHYDASIELTEKSAEPYYYHNNSLNNFTPRDFSLELKAEDYLPAIKCKENPYGTFDPSNDITKLGIVRFFSWQKPGDLVCYCRRLWSCNTEIPGLPQSNSIQEGGSIPAQLTQECKPLLQYLGGSFVCCQGGEFEVKDAC